MMVKLIALDFIGVIANYNKGFNLNAFIEKAISHANTDIQNARTINKAWHRHTLKYGCDPFKTIKSLDEFFDSLYGKIDGIILKRMGKEIDYISGTEFYSPVEGLGCTLEILVDLGVKLCIVTHVRENVVSIFLETNNISKLFWEIYCWPKKSKVTGKIYDQLMQDILVLGLHQSEILVVDDDPENLIQAKNHHFNTMRFITNKPKDFFDTNMIQSLTSLAELVPLVNDLSKLHGV